MSRKNPLSLLPVKGVRTIASVVFLGLFGVMSVHNLVPHVHHDHADDHEHVHGHVAAHNHSHDDHGHQPSHGMDPIHDEEPSNEKGLDDLLVLLFGSHTHTFQVQHSDVEVRLVQTQQLAPLDIIEPSQVIDFSSVADVYRYYLFKPRIYPSAFYSSKSLRAPPVLG